MYYIPPEKKFAVVTQKSLSIILSLILICLLFVFPASIVEAAADGMVRVYLTQLGSPKTLAFTTTCTYAVNGNGSQRINGGTAVKVTLEGGKLYVTEGGKKTDVGTSFALTRGSRGVQGVRFTTPAKSNLFCGDLLFSISGGAISTVIRMYVEDYLYGVVAYEMSDGFPIEALKAQAIAARTYVMRYKKSSGAYDVTDTTTHQVFKGYNASYSNVIRAVNETKGICAMYGGAYAQCYYAASNGGQTELTQNIWSGSIPYIKMKDDPYDLANPSSVVKSHKIYKKPTSSTPLNASLKLALIEGMASQLSIQGMKTAASSVTIDEILAVELHTPLYKAPSKTFTEARFIIKVTATSASTDQRKALDLPIEVNLKTYDTLESMLGLGISTLKNEIISVESSANAFDICFRRFGHGVGMSQRGAQQMAGQHKKSYRDILLFYFEGISLTNVDFSDSTGSFTDGSTTYSTLQNGSTGEAVKKLQTRLKQLGYFTGSIGGNYLTLTTTAVKEFQAVNGLKVDGVATDQVQQLLYSSAAKSKPQATASPKPTPTPTPTPSPTPTPTPSPTQNVKKYARVKLKKSSDRLKVYAKAASSSKVLAKLKPNTRVKVLSLSGSWAKIQVGSNKGYVDGRYLVYEDTGKAVFATPTPKPTPTPTPKPTPTPTVSVNAYAYINMKKTSDKLTVYQKASKSGKKLGTVKHGIKVRVKALNASWAKIELNGKQGYVEKKYLIAK